MYKFIDTNIYIYIHIHIYIYIEILFFYRYIYLYIYLYLYIYIYIHTYIYIHIYLFAVYIYIYIYMHICMDILYIYIYIHVYMCKMLNHVKSPNRSGDTSPWLQVLQLWLGRRDLTASTATSQRPQGKVWVGKPRLGDDWLRYIAYKHVGHIFL